MKAERAVGLANKFVHFIETGEVPAGLFAADIFCDFTLPYWRLQAQGVKAVVAARKERHPNPGIVPRWRCDVFPGGFVIEFEERWNQDGKNWYSREIARADVVNDAIANLSVYCTGDWDEALIREHKAAVTLLHP
jgi:hypothetical protein